MERLDSSGDLISAAVRFNDHINARNPDGLANLMTPEHRFVDTASNETIGRETMRDGWKTFFESWPDYRNVFQTIVRSGNRVIMIGRSHCSDPSLDGPAIWRATFEEDLVAEWRVWEDTPETRRALGIPKTQFLSTGTG